jgi:hypothetical protein
VIEGDEPPGIEPRKAGRAHLVAGPAWTVGPTGDRRPGGARLAGAPLSLSRHVDEHSSLDAKRGSSSLRPSLRPSAVGL